MTLQGKLNISFGFILLLVMLQTGLTIILLGRIAERSAGMVGPALSRVDDLAHMESDILRLRTDQYLLLAGSDSGAPQQLDSEISELKDSISQHSARYSSSDLDQDRAARFARIRNEYQRFLLSVDAAQRAASEGSGAQALPAYFAFQSDFARLDGELHDLRHQEYQVTEALTGQMDGLATWSRLPAGLTVGAIAIVELLLGWHVSRGMRRSLGTLERGAERIARQQFEEPIAPPPEPELATLALTLNDVMRTMISHNREAALREEERLRSARERVNQVVRAQERERARISRELHDQASQGLTALAYGLTRLHAQLSGSPAGAEADRLLALSADTGRQIAALARDLRPGVLDDLGLIPALRSYARDFSDRIGIPATLSVQGPIPRLSGETETAVFRVVQEALTNVAKHAQARHVLVDIRRCSTRAAAAVPGCLEVEVTDDGQGFNAEEFLHSSFSTASPPALGLAGIRERVELLGGELRLASRPGQGTRLGVSIPLSEPAAIIDQRDSLQAGKAAPEVHAV